MLKILYICTHNRCRSILSEALTNHYGEGMLEARSAGSQPSGEVHPLTIRFLQQVGVDTTGLKSQSWHDFESYQPDIVITVCDSAAGEVCPVWFGKSLKIHWGLSDPSKIAGTDSQKEQGFLSCIEIIKKRIDAVKDIVKNNTSNDVSNIRESLIALGAH